MTVSNPTLTFLDKPVIIALFGPKGCGKTTVADMLGFPQYQFNQWAIEQLCETYNKAESTFKDATIKDKEFAWHTGTLSPLQFIETPRQLLIGSVEDALATNSDKYIADNLDHFGKWLEAKDVQDSYAVVLPSIRREFELDYLTELDKCGYHVICVELVREGCEYSDEHVTEQNLFDSATWRTSSLFGGGYYFVDNNKGKRDIATEVLDCVITKLRECEGCL